MFFESCSILNEFVPLDDSCAYHYLLMWMMITSGEKNMRE